MFRKKLFSGRQVSRYACIAISRVDGEDLRRETCSDCIVIISDGIVALNRRLQIEPTMSDSEATFAWTRWNTGKLSWTICMVVRCE